LYHRILLNIFRQPTYKSPDKQNIFFMRQMSIFILAALPNL